MQSLLSHLLHEQTEGDRQLKKLKFVWIQRDPELMVQSKVADLSSNLYGSKHLTVEEDMNESRSVVGLDRFGLDRAASLASLILATIPPSQETDEQLDSLYESSTILVVKDTIRTSDEEGKENNNASSQGSKRNSDVDKEAVEQMHGNPFDNLLENVVGFLEMVGSVLPGSKSENDDKSSGEMVTDSPSTSNETFHVGPLVDEGEDTNGNSPNSPDEVTVDLEHSESISHMSEPRKRDEDLQAVEAEMDLEDEAGSKLPNSANIGDLVDIDIYLTKSRDALTPHNLPGLKFGRPDIAALFAQMRQEAIEQGEKRVAVCACGPKRITYLCRKACIELSDRKVRFDFHQETFG